MQTYRAVLPLCHCHHTDVTGGPCKDHSYVLEQIHLHWGEDDSAGSEHHINAHSFAAEVSTIARLWQLHADHQALG